MGSQEPLADEVSEEAIKAAIDFIKLSCQLLEEEI